MVWATIIVVAFLVVVLVIVLGSCAMIAWSLWCDEP